jgi:transcriptional regulator GlxA family with amidase domain
MEAMSLFCHEPKDRRIRRSLELLQQTPPAEISMIAAAVGLSTSRLRHLFTKELGRSPGSFLKLTLLHRARQLLLNSFLSVKEIASHAGFTDVSHFVRDYKELYGETPSQTRVIHKVQVPANTNSNFGQ